MQLVEMECTVNAIGELAIPSVVLDEIGVAPNDAVQLIYFAKQGTDLCKEFALVNPALPQQEDQHIQLPESLLTEACIEGSADLSVHTMRGAIIICEEMTLDLLALQEILKGLNIACRIAVECSTSNVMEE